MYELDQHKESDRIKEAFRHCRYLDWTFELVEAKQKKGKTNKKLVLPYLKGLSEATARVH